MKNVSENNINFIVCSNTKSIQSNIMKKYKHSIKNVLMIFPLSDEIELTQIDEEALSKIDAVICAGDGKEEPLECDFDKVLKIRDDCVKLNKNFIFRDTGRLFKMNGKVYHIPKGVGKEQAKKAKVDYFISQVDKEIYEEETLWERLAKSKFRSKFKMSQKDKDYYGEKGEETINSHAHDFIEKRLAPKNPKRYGRQTPLNGHPVFLAQHATGTCCRGCLEKWHRIPQNKALDAEEQNYVCNVIMAWIKKEMEN